MALDSQSSAIYMVKILGQPNEKLLFMSLNTGMVHLIDVASIQHIDEQMESIFHLLV